MSKPRCFFCNKPVTEEYFCFGCSTHICDQCDHENEWPPEGHTKPQQHPLRNPKHKKEIRDMSKKHTQEIATLNTQLANERRNTQIWQDGYNAQMRASQQAAERNHERVTQINAKHAHQTSEIVKAGMTAIEMSRLEGERDGALMALKLVLNNKH